MVYPQMTPIIELFRCNMINFKHYKLQEEVMTQQVEGWTHMVNSNPYLYAAVSLLDELEKMGGEAYIVGGAVRDILLNKSSHDIDIATNVPMADIEKKFNSAEIGQSRGFGILNVKYGEFNFEVAQFRTESGYSDNRRPDTVETTKSFEKDTERRDLTINSMGLDKNGTIIDYQGGIEDLNNKIIKSVGVAKYRFMEDSLRILRVVRFAARMGFKIDPETKAALNEMGHLVENISPERIRDEMFKAAESGKTLASFFELLNDTGILEKILPEFTNLQGKPHTKETHPEGDAYEHTMAAIRASTSTNPITNLAVAFHDLGKAITLTFNDTGKPQYKGHENEGLVLIDAIANRLKFSNKDKHSIKFAMANHMQFHHIKDMKKSKVLSMRQSPDWEHLKHTMYSDEASRGAPLFNPEEFQAKMDYIEDVYKKFGETAEFEAKMATLITGKIIIDLIPGIKGPVIGKIKDAVRQWIVDNDFNVTPSQVEQKIKELGNV